jgi:hypothetical protein
MKTDGSPVSIGKGGELQDGDDGWSTCSDDEAEVEAGPGPGPEAEAEAGAASKAETEAELPAMHSKGGSKIYQGRWSADGLVEWNDYMKDRASPHPYAMLIWRGFKRLNPKKQKVNALMFQKSLLQHTEELHDQCYRMAKMHHMAGLAPAPNRAGEYLHEALKIMNEEGFDGDDENEDGEEHEDYEDEEEDENEGRSAEAGPWADFDDSDTRRVSRFNAERQKHQARRDSKKRQKAPDTDGAVEEVERARLAELLGRVKAGGGSAASAVAAGAAAKAAGAGAQGVGGGWETCSDEDEDGEEDAYNDSDSSNAPAAQAKAAAAATSKQHSKKEKVKPNAPCPCGSGKKAKKCCHIGGM